MTWWEIAYALVGAGFWRTLTGHFAWEAHRTAKTTTTMRPSVETWAACSVPAFFMSVAWPITGLFVIPWPFKRGTERKAERVLAKMEFVSAKQQLEAEEARLEKELGMGAHMTEENPLLRGDVID